MNQGIELAWGATERFGEFFESKLSVAADKLIMRASNNQTSTEKSRTTISPKLDGIPVSLSTTSLIPSGGFLIKSRTSRPARANVRGGKFSALMELELAPRRYPALRAGAADTVDMMIFSRCLRSSLYVWGL